MATFLDTQRVQRLRNARGMTQTDLAMALNVPASTVARLENGRQEADCNTVELLAQQLGCASDTLARPVADVLYTRPWLRAYADAPKKTVDQYVADTLLVVRGVRGTASCVGCQTDCRPSGVTPITTTI